MTIRAFLPSPSFHNAAHQLTIGVIALSILHGLLGDTSLLFLPKATLYELELWRPLSSLLIAISPAEIIFGALIIYSIGGSLEESWGKRRFLRIALGIPLAAELATLILFAVTPSLREIPYHGASMIISTVWIAYGLRAAFSRYMLNFWGAPLRGETFALIGLGFIVLGGVFNGIITVIPELFSAGFTYLYMYKRNITSIAEVRRRIELAYYNWKLKRLKRKAGLRVVKGSQDDSDKNPKYH